MRESGGSGSQESILRKSGVRKLRSLIWKRLKDFRCRTLPFSHQAKTPTRLKFRMVSSRRPARAPTSASVRFRSEKRLHRNVRNLIPHRMPKKQDAAVIRSEEARTVNGIGAFIVERQKHLQEVGGGDYGTELMKDVGPPGGRT